MLYLYLAMTDHIVSSILVIKDERIHRPIYYTSKSLLDAETRYTPSEKLAFTLVVAARKVYPYFQAYSIIVLTYQPLR